MQIFYDTLTFSCGCHHVLNIVNLIYFAGCRASDSYCLNGVTDYYLHHRDIYIHIALIYCLINIF